MKITEKQLLMLYQIAVDSLKISDGGYSAFIFKQETRRLLVDKMVNQQSEELIDVDRDIKND